MKIVKTLMPYVITIVVVLLIKAFIVAPVRVKGDSMLPTLESGDIMILDKISYRFRDIERFDIVVVDNGNTPLIKRVIGLPGDSIKVIDNELYINDKAYVEEYLSDTAYTHNFSLESLLNIETIPADYYFVLGDNRSNSIDSRMIGLISKDSIEGRAILTIFPFDRMGTKD